MSANVPLELPAIDDPLPRRFLTGGTGIGGSIKDRPEDFLVEELPLYAPSGVGEHIYIGVEKTNVSHAELMSCVRRRFGVSDKAVGFAGMKDKAAVTRQTLSIRCPGDRKAPESLGHDRITLLWASRHRNKIRLGHLAGNRFSIRIRDVDPVKVTAVHRVMAELERRGLPNYFGAQRFGYRCNNHLLGLLLVRRDWRGILAELLGTPGSPFPEYQRSRRVLFDEGRYAEAAAEWTPADRNELTCANAMRDGRDAAAAVRAAGQRSLSFWVSALQSAIFNRVLDTRIDAGTLGELAEGDLAWRHPQGAVFRVTPDELTDELVERQATLELSPTGPLWGAGMTRAGAAVDAVELAALDRYGLSPDDLGVARLKGARRPLRVPVRNPMTDAGVDEHGAYVRVAFDLPAGAYATVLLGEIMKA